MHGVATIFHNTSGHLLILHLIRRKIFCCQDTLTIRIKKIPFRSCHQLVVGGKHCDHNLFMARLRNQRVPLRCLIALIYLGRHFFHFTHFLKIVVVKKGVEKKQLTPAMAADDTASTLQTRAFKLIYLRSRLKFITDSSNGFYHVPIIA